MDSALGSGPLHLRPRGYHANKIFFGDTKHTMSKKSRTIHKETFTTVFTGLLINYPLNLIGLFVCIDILKMTSAFHIGTTITAFMTCIAYTRVYLIRRYFYMEKH